jgi:hypothetical protein
LQFYRFTIIHVESLPNYWIFHFDSDEIAQKAASIINQQFARRPSLLQLSHIHETVSDDDPSSSTKSDFLKYYLPQLDDSPNQKNEVSF